MAHRKPRSTPISQSDMSAMCSKKPVLKWLLPDRSETMQTPRLPIDNMAQRHHGLTQAIAEQLTEGARVCLDRHHQSPTEFHVHWEDRRTDALVVWEPTDDRTKAAWANETDTTEAGACACVLAAIEMLDELVAVRRAETGTGADYYLAPPGTPADDWENFLRLEVSGTDQGNESTVADRLRRKLQQAESGASDLPAIAGVVGFRAKLIRLANLEEP